MTGSVYVLMVKWTQQRKGAITMTYEDLRKKLLDYYGTATGPSPAAWGDVLHTNLPNAPHGNGDFLICRAGEDGNPDLSDVWVLNGVLFTENYDTANMEETAE